MIADVQRKVLETLLVLFPQEKIAAELISHEEEIKNNTYGKFVFKKCKLKKFKGKKDEWIEKQTQNEQKRALFSDILSLADTSKPVAKKNVPEVKEVAPVENSNKKRKQEVWRRLIEC